MIVDETADSRPAVDEAELRLVLADLPAGDSAEIVGLDAAAPVDVQTRLQHLGFRPGTRVKMVRAAPLTDPATYRLLGAEICLRRREAAYIQIGRW
ncbi:FeoA family protein [Mycobacterium marinum]|uniref:FeoA family protein n=2 Tax=Mycobacterium marinum TaxID=1781 RepID=UPI00041EA7C6|nr:FeoA family protein [Mycobacterium marinum]MDC8974758.1 FeoA family protein [Mycobacterium marinum]MDC9014266.1 FeoA family protein [Mycobacterium marinum]